MAEPTSMFSNANQPQTGARVHPWGAGTDLPEQNTQTVFRSLLAQQTITAPLLTN